MAIANGTTHHGPGATGSVALPLYTAFSGPGDLSQPADLRIWPSASKAAPKVVVIFVPGNPGLVDYYLEFLSTIHSRLDRDAPVSVYAIGHLGHSGTLVPSTKDVLYPISKSWGGKPCPSLDDQVRHKVAFVDWVRGQVPQETKVVLISHSVGSYICSKVVDARPDAIQHAYCLFPTISHILLTPNGRRLWFLWYRFVPLVAFLLVSLLQVLPRFVLQSIVGAVTRQKDPAAKVTTDLIASPAAVACTLVMSQDEMHDIKDLDRDFIGRHRDKLTFYWAAGEIDGWVPDARVQEVIEVLGSQKRERPEWYRCDEEMVHAFCLDHSLPMAIKCSKWIHDDWLRA